VVFRRRTGVAGFEDALQGAGKTCTVYCWDGDHALANP
jgi:hypothetical protein